MSSNTFPYYTPNATVEIDLYFSKAITDHMYYYTMFKAQGYI